MVARSYSDQNAGGPATTDVAGELASPRAALVDPHGLLTHAVTEELTRAGIPTTGVWAGSPDEILNEIYASQPTIVLLEQDLPDPPGPPEPLIKMITDFGLRVVILTSSSDHVALGRCLEAGAVGIIDKKRASFAELVAAIRAASQDSGALNWQSRSLLAEVRRSRAEEQRQRAPFALLTPRERQVLAFMCDGWGPSEIAEATFVSLATVRSHVRSILLKLGVHSQLAAAAMAYRSGWYQEQDGIHQF